MGRGMGKDWAKEALAVEGLEMGQVRGEEGRDRDRGVMAGKDFRKGQGSGKEVQEGEDLERDQARDEGDLTGEVLEGTGLECFALNMPTIQNLIIRRKPGRKDTRE